MLVEPFDCKTLSARASGVRPKPMTALSTVARILLNDIIQETAGVVLSWLGRHLALYKGSRRCDHPTQGPTFLRIDDDLWGTQEPFYSEDVISFLQGIGRSTTGPGGSTPE